MNTPILISLLVALALLAIAYVQYRKGVIYLFTNDREKAFNMVVLLLLTNLLVTRYVVGSTININIPITDPHYLSMISLGIGLLIKTGLSVLSLLSTVLICLLWRKRPSERKPYKYFV